AVEKVAASVENYDCVLMDIQMPIMNGYEATKKIRELENPKLANVPIIAMTANAFSEDVKAALDAGMNGHIAKPIDVGKMMETFAKILPA
ncbi:MAG: response regulator, partial [Selenomonadaceae bacterium]|nr:response regulator [Selenomonadaceae bacterium]